MARRGSGLAWAWTWPTRPISWCVHARLALLKGEGIGYRVSGRAWIPDTLYPSPRIDPDAHRSPGTLLAGRNEERLQATHRGACARGYLEGAHAARGERRSDDRRL